MFRQPVEYVHQVHVHIDGLAQDCSNSIANALELLQSCAKPSICLALIYDRSELYLYVIALDL